MNPGYVDWLGQFTQSLTDLTTQNGGALSNFGMILLTFIATMMLIGIAVRMTSWSVHLGGYHAVSLDELKVFLFRFLFCLVLEHYWINNLPGGNFGFNRMFSYMSAEISKIIDQGALNQLNQLFATAGQQTPSPNILSFLQTFCYYWVQGLLGIASGVLFLINTSGFIFYGVAALFGPLFIPLYLTETFRGKFLHFVDVLLSFAMIRAVAAAFIYVWAQFLNGFITQTFHGDYSIQMWLVNLVPFAAIFIAFILNMVLVPTITQTIFGGGSGIAGKLGQAAESLIALAATRGI